MHVRRQFAMILVFALTVLVAPALLSAQTAQPAQPAPELREVTQDKPAPAEADQAPAAAPAEGAAPAGEEGEQQPAPKRGPFGDTKFFLILIGGFLLLYIWMGRSRRKKEAKHRQMLSDLKKGDKVTSIGGIVGTVIEVREDELVVKVDETNNVRMRFARWAIRGIGEEAKTKKPEEK